MVCMGVVPRVPGLAAEVISLQNQQPLKKSKVGRNMVRAELRLACQS